MRCKSSLDWSHTMVVFLSNMKTSFSLMQARFSFWAIGACLLTQIASGWAAGAPNPARSSQTNRLTSDQTVNKLVEMEGSLAELGQSGRRPMTFSLRSGFWLQAPPSGQVSRLDRK